MPAKKIQLNPGSDETLSEAIKGIASDMHQLTRAGIDPCVKNALDSCLKKIRANPDRSAVREFRAVTRDLVAKMETSTNSSLSANLWRKYGDSKAWLKLPEFAQKYGLTVVEKENWVGVVEKTEHGLVFHGEWDGHIINGVYQNGIQEIEFSQDKDLVAVFSDGRLSVEEGHTPEGFAERIASIDRANIMKIEDLEDAVKNFAVAVVDSGFELSAEPPVLEYTPYGRRKHKPIDQQKRRKAQKYYKRHKQSILKAAKKYRKTANGRRAAAMSQKRQRMHAWNEEAAFKIAKPISSFLTRALIELEHNADAAEFLEICGPTLISAVAMLPKAILGKDFESIEKAAKICDFLFVEDGDIDISVDEGDEKDDFDAYLATLDWSTLGEEDLIKLLGDEFYKTEVVPSLESGESDTGCADDDDEDDEMDDEDEKDEAENSFAGRHESVTDGGQENMNENDEQLTRLDSILQGVAS